MTTIMLIFTLALTCALTATPIVRRLARRLGFLDQPAERKVHVAPVPLMGGVAIYAAVILSVVLLGHHFLGELMVILLAATVMALTGLWDDRSHLHAVVKLGLQLLVGIGLFFAGVRVQLGWLPAWANFGLTILWIAGITNALNLLDNMDGLSGGISAVAAAFFAVIAAMNGQYMVASLSAAVLGACLGFLVFNTKPASIFMGDSGSLFLGLLLAVIGIKLRFPGHSSFVTWMVPLLVLWIPIFDTTLVTLSRMRRGLNPLTTPGKDHVSHRLVARGRTQLEAVLLLYVAAGACGLLAVFVMQASLREGYQIGAALLALSAWLMWRSERRHYDKPPSL
jgi:UDP-GlcNAc:undecaprenyl-phosphate GlcNAc-1-phosphate transferase